MAAPTGLSLAFLVGNFLIGFAAAVFGHATLTATMNRAPKEQAGLALGAWGAVQATAAGVAMALGGVIRDLVDAVVQATGSFGELGDAAGYLAVYGLEIVLLLVTIAALGSLIRRRDGACHRQVGGENGLSLDRGKLVNPIETGDRIAR